MLTYDQGHAVPIADIMAYIAKQYPAVDKRGVLHHSTKKLDSYFSPFRQERTASFKVNKNNNRWTDFGTGFKGYRSGIDLLIYHWGRDPSDKLAQRQALEVLATIDPNPEIKAVPDEPGGYSEHYRIHKRGPLKKCKKLVAVMRDRGIPLEIAEEFLYHAVVEDTEAPKSRAYQDCFGCDNIKDGTDVFHPTWKNCIGPKAPSVYPQADGSAHMVLHGDKQIRMAIAELKKYKSAIMFEGISDYLTFLTMGGGSAEPEAVYSYLDNDAAGQGVQLILGDALHNMDWELRPQNHIYEGYKDLNKWWSENTQEHYKFTSERRPEGSKPNNSLKYNR